MARRSRRTAADEQANRGAVKQTVDAFGLGGGASQWPYVAEILQGSTGGVPLAGWVELAQPLHDKLPHESGGGAR
ncbi:MAG: hypothetical protein H0V67_00785 [Geodermatophilaceae bacterium]|nr:hypothetical protein [Geodermatophilaceae bacterium]